MKSNKQTEISESKARQEPEQHDDIQVVEGKQSHSQMVAISGVSHNVQLQTNQNVPINFLCSMALEAYQQVLLIENANREGRMIAFNKQEENLNEEKN